MNYPGESIVLHLNNSPFSTRAWRENWWKEWGSDIEGQRVVGERSCESIFYLHRYQWRYLPIKSLQFIGTGDRCLSTPRAEYLALPSDANVGLLDSLFEVEWTEAVFRDLVAGQESYELLLFWARTREMYLRTIHTDSAYQISLKGDFSGYLSRLGPNTRLKLYNRRKRLTSMGSVREELWSVAPFLELLNQFHSKRWGTPCFNSRSLRFQRRFLADIVQEGGRPELRVLMVNGEPVSGLYNLVLGGCVYNIQSGFLENYGKDIALGTLHLGYALEDAFACQGPAWFDLLAGQGKNTDYKRHLATHETPLVSLMIVRHPFYRFMYRMLDWWKSFRF
ncbi:CelD/BcsL family acetyltransferase involved in cellulose biosynthesis [Halospina denitrificans]|uniref:CelD/BcsL family acetyltransferase involved in cellulose biosynthesis n=1 Tax=Halospina denitrificans TaxID=332522 RepID=A0A4R7JQL6_9GAMM|nr:GNAT family N-acetyltransferase [Halospina denitrificans]TDT39483.1 CelD/BcsL family acetyltransferase involved in cellulose biosynthesis [Halospina denitrificans]